MLFEKCCEIIENAGFGRLKSQTEAVGIYYCYRQECMYTVLVWNEASLAGISPELIENQDRSIEAFFVGKGIINFRILNIICTYNTTLSRRNIQAGFPVWFMDMTSGRLIIYEEQPEDYAGLREIFESDENLSGGGGSRPGRRDGNRRAFAYVNWLFIAVNIIVYVLMEMNGSTSSTKYLLQHGALNVSLIMEYGEYYRLFTSMFMHSGFSHLFNNMLVLFFIGDNLERAVGHGKYFIMYLAGGLLSNAVALLCYGIMDVNICCVGASGAIFSVVGALLYIVLVNRGRLEDLSAGKLALFIFMSIYLGLRSATTSNSAHIGGLAAGFILAVLIYRKRKGTSL